MLNSDDGALRIPGATSRHEPADADWSRLAELLTTYYAGGLFTILQVDRARGLVRRAYTSEPVAYPTGGTKQLMGTQWAKQVIHEGRCYIASTLVEMEGAFADHRALLDLGCTTALNIPMRRGSEVAWTVNMLRGGAVYTISESHLVKAIIKEWIGDLFLTQSEFSGRS